MKNRFRLPVWETFPNNLPVRPYCTNSFEHGLFVRTRQEALQFRYIQPNHPRFRQWLVFDIDRPYAFEAALEANLPNPNLIVTTPQNGHAHLSWCLETPVYLGKNARDAPSRFAEAVHRGFVRRLGADARYSGLMTKNPFSDAWKTQWVAPWPYALEVLASDLSKHDMRYEASSGSDNDALGRNCTLFEALRHIAYREVIRFKQSGATVANFNARMEHIAWELNSHFSTPLRKSEVRVLVNSVSTWVWRNFTQYKFAQIQAARSAKAAEKRQIRSRELQERVRSLAFEAPQDDERMPLLSDMDKYTHENHHNGINKNKIQRSKKLSVAQIANNLGVAQVTVKKHIAAIYAQEKDAKK